MNIWYLIATCNFYLENYFWQNYFNESRISNDSIINKFSHFVIDADWKKKIIPNFIKFFLFLFKLIKKKYSYQWILIINHIFLLNNVKKYPQLSENEQRERAREKIANEIFR